MYLCRDIAGMQLSQNRGELWKRDHTTVMHACRKIKRNKKKMEIHKTNCG